jgi:hypothetical protein
MTILSIAGFAYPQELIHCPANPNSAGDNPNRGLYVPSYPGTSLGVVILSFGCRSSGERTFALTARSDSYDGPILGVAQATVVTSGGTPTIHPARFDFRGVPVDEGETVTFSLELLSGPPDVACYYNTGTNNGELCEGLVVETDDTTPPLSEHRRDGMGITIFPGVGPTPTTYWVAVVSRADGFDDSVWRSALSLLNRGIEEATVTLRLHLGGIHERSLFIPGGAEVILEDVVDWVESGLTGSGALEIVSDEALLVVARTANTLADGVDCYPGGSFGQVFEGRTVHSGLVTEETVRLSSLRETATERTNIGFTNTGSTQADVSYTLYDADGDEVYASEVLTLAPGEWHQENRPYRARAGLSDVDGGWAVVKVVRGTGVQVYASLIDAETSDPATLWGVR